MIFEIQGLTYTDLRSIITITKEVMIQDSTMKPHGGPVHGVSFTQAVVTIPLYPFAYVVTNYTCRNRNQKSDDNIQNSTPPSCWKESTA